MEAREWAVFWPLGRQMSPSQVDVGVGEEGFGKEWMKSDETNVAGLGSFYCITCFFLYSIYLLSVVLGKVFTVCV